MGFYENMGQTTKRMLTKYGKNITITRRVDGTYDPTTGTVPATETEYTAVGQVFDYDARVMGQSGGLILAGDRKVLLAAADLSFDPSPTTDRVTLNGDQYAIVQVKKPVDEDVLLELQVRRVQ